MPSWIYSLIQARSRIGTIRRRDYHLIRLYFAIFLLVTAKSGLAYSHIEVTNSEISKLLPQSTIFSIAKDSYGLFWIATPTGVFRYDGSRISKFSKFPLGIDTIQKLIGDEDGYIWFFDQFGNIGVIDIYSQSSRNVLFNDFDSQNHRLLGIERKANGGVYIINEDSVIIVDSLEDNIFFKISENQKGTELENISAYTADSDGALWIAFKNGLAYIKSEFKQAITYPLPKFDYSFVKDRRPVALTIGGEDEIIFAQNDGSIFVFNKDAFSFQQVDILENRGDFTIVDLAFTLDRLWIATDIGLISHDFRFNSSSLITTNNSNLSNDHLTVLHPLSNKLLIGTYQGLDFLTLSAFKKFNVENSGISNEVMGFTQDEDGTLWIATYKGLFRAFRDGLTGSTLHKKVSALDINSQRVMSVAALDSDIWCGYRTGGVKIFKKKTRNWVDAFPSLRQSQVTKIYHDRYGYTWLTTFNDGIFRIDRAKLNENIADSLSKFSIASRPATLIEELDENELIIGGENFLYLVNRYTGNLVEVALRFPDFLSPTILSITKIGNDEIWVGTSSHGIFRGDISDFSDFDINLTEVITPSEANLNTIYSIESDNSGRIWVSSSNGLHILQNDGDYIKGLQLADGLQGLDFNFSSSFKDSSGALYFGGSNGYNKIPHDYVTPPSIVSDILLTDIRVKSERLSTQIAMSQIEELHLKYDDNFLALEFNVLDFLDPSKNQYRYKLEGFDPDWIDNGNRNVVNYTNLPAGKYILRVQGANSAGVWNLEGTSIKIFKQKAPWYRWWAFVIYALPLLLFFWFLKKYYDRKLIAAHATKAAQEGFAAADKAIDELQEQLEFQAGLLRNVRSHNQSILELLNECIDRQSEQILNTNDRENSLHTKRRVKALAKLETCLTYQDDILLADIREFINAISPELILSSGSDPDSITIINDVKAENISVNVASPLAVILYELVQNSIQHAFPKDRFANYIRIQIRRVYEDDKTTPYYLCSVSDDGTGFPANLPIRRWESGGLGIVKSISKKFDWEIELDLSEGTNIRFRIPIESHLIPGNAGRAA